MKATLMFHVTERRENVSGVGGVKMGGLKLGPIYPKEGHALYSEMKNFYSYTPGGQIDFSTVNEAVLDSFPPGTICRITIEPYTEPESPA